jgi:dihydrofolate reductase
MGKVIAQFAMSLDCFIADAEDEVGRLYRWLSEGEISVEVANSGMVFKTSPASAEIFREVIENTGAIVTGRRDFDVSKAWGGKAPVGDHCFIVTHSVPPEWANSPNFTFVTDGIENAVERAKKVSGEKNTSVSGSQITQQSLKLGLLEEIHIDLVPVLLGKGIRLFDHLDVQPIELEITRVIDAPGVTHLAYRIVK